MKGISRASLIAVIVVVVAVVIAIALTAQAYYASMAPTPPAPLPIPTATPTHQLPTTSQHLSTFRENPELFVSHTLIHHVIFVDESGNQLGNLTSIHEVKREGYTVYETLNFTFVAEPSVEDLTLCTGVVWLLTEGPYPVPIPHPGFEPVTLRSGGSLLFHNSSDEFEGGWNWTQITILSIVGCFNLTLSDGRHLLGLTTNGDASRTCRNDLCFVYYWLFNTGGDLLEFLYQNRIETVTKYAIMVEV